MRKYKDNCFHFLRLMSESVYEVNDYYFGCKMVCAILLFLFTHLVFTFAGEKGYFCS